jgi:ATP synthase protein I
MLLKKFFTITDKSYLTALSQAGVIGLHLVSGIIVGALLGHALDRWLDSSPVCTLIFLAVGIVAGFKNVYVDTRRLLATQKKEDEERFAAAREADPPKNGG